jgi:nucleoside-diphosphate-sugar epimerase
MKILVTGTSGFVGTRFQSFVKNKYEIVPVSLRTIRPAKIDFTGIDVILHLAVVAHDSAKSNDPVQYLVNVDLTRELAEAAMKAGVPHFIFMSTAKVYGEESNQPLNEYSACHPVDAYGKSKLMAEKLLLELNSNQFKVAIIRPPLVYGPAVKGNMLRILHLADKPWSLPFKNAGNQRSMVFIDNLIELIEAVLFQRAEGVFIAGDSEPLSTGDLVSMIRKSMNRKEGLFKVPLFIKSTFRKFKPALFNRLYGSFILDPESTNRRLKYKPTYSTQAGITIMVNWFINHKQSLPLK